MKHLHLMVLRSLPGPFAGWLGVLMFLFLMQFLMRYLADLVGRGLPILVLVELVIYNLAYMMVLAVPMAVLLTMLMAYGKLAETNAYQVMKSAGISMVQMMWPTWIAGALVMCGMLYFNNIILPEANFRARTLWMDIKNKKPGFELQPGVFYQGVNRYSILVEAIDHETGELRNVNVYDYTEGARRPAIIKASVGHIQPKNNGARIDLILEEGEMHRLIPPVDQSQGDRYERLQFAKHRLRLNLDDFVFERSSPREGLRSDRTMQTGAMLAFVDSLDASIERRKASIREMAMDLARDTLLQSLEPTSDGAIPLPQLASPTDTLKVANERRPHLSGLTTIEQEAIYDVALDRARAGRTKLERASQMITFNTGRANKYRVEIHKKFSIAFACVIFILVGVPLGLRIKRGGLGTAGILATCIFLFYWVTLVNGEKLADRGKMVPWVGMWMANAIIAGIGMFFIVAVVKNWRIATYRFYDLLDRLPSMFSKKKPPIHR